MNKVAEIKNFIVGSAGGYTGLTIVYDGSEPHLIFTGILTPNVKDEVNADTTFVDGDIVDISDLTEADINAMLGFNSVV